MDIPGKKKTAVPKGPGNTYQCGNCDAKFQSVKSPEVCPKCGVMGSENFSTIFVEFDAEQAQMETKDDWQAGD